MKLPPAERCASILNMKIRFAIIAFLFLGGSAYPQQNPQPQHKPQNQIATADRLGMTCSQILAMNSADWIAKSVQAFVATNDGELRGIRAYGQCYDARTDQLAATLARKGTGPKKTALANLKDFQAGIESFTAKTLADVEPPAEPAKTAYAALYEKQFRYEFYEVYLQKTVKPPLPPKDSKLVVGKAPEAAETKSMGAPAASTGAKSSDLPPAPTPKLADVPEGIAKKHPAPPPPATAAANPPSAEPAPKEVDPFTKAKNHFGELLGLLPEEKVHEVHSAFGKLFSGNPVSEDLKVEVYKYAIFLLERPSDKPFAPPPF
jgi:hypothetical protein